MFDCFNFILWINGFIWIWWCPCLIVSYERVNDYSMNLLLFVFINCGNISGANWISLIIPNVSLFSFSFYYYFVWFDLLRSTKSINRTRTETLTETANQQSVQQFKLKIRKSQVDWSNELKAKTPMDDVCKVHLLVLVS